MIQRINSLENVTQFIDEFISKDSADPRETMLLGKNQKTKIYLKNFLRTIFYFYFFLFLILSFNEEKFLLLKVLG